MAFVADRGLSEPSAGLPSRQTLFRWRLQGLCQGNDSPGDLVGLPGPIRSLVEFRLRMVVRQIEDARDVGDVLVLAAQAIGPAEAVWHARMRHFGPGAVRLIARGLERCAGSEGTGRDIVAERLIGALLWYGEAAAELLAETVTVGQPYEGSLASVVLGLLRHRPAGDDVWRFYEANRDRELGVNRPYVGALWALRDLGDPRCGRALAELVHEGRRFYELYGLAALACGAEGAAPLLEAMRLVHGDAQRDVLMALAAVATRMGRANFTHVVTDEYGEDEATQAAELTDLLLNELAGQVAVYYACFYH